MTPPNATPTRADVLREFSTPHLIYTGEEFQWDGQTWDEPTRESLADEVLRLRAQLATALHGLCDVSRLSASADEWLGRKYADESQERRKVQAITRKADAVLAALREGGDDGRR